MTKGLPVLLMSVVQRHARDAAHAAWLLDLLERFEGPLLRYARRLLRDEERARDVVQDTFLRLCEQPRDEVEGKARAWLFTVCRNRAFDVRKKEGRMATNDDERLGAQTSGAPSPVAVAERSETSSQLLELVDELPGKQREVVLLKFQSGCSYKEIAQITQTSVGNVGYLLHVAIKRLRSQLQADVAVQG
tara:strand:+ start:67 stop:636 length:570 start_codon:yes stop_codon:yes gene_type:complete